jgi:ubiquinone/menaquinone biosynthesis C-methylase UbiE
VLDCEKGEAMKPFRQLAAKAAATHFVWISFSMPVLLESRSFLHAMGRIFSRLAPAYDRLGEKLAREQTILGPLRMAVTGLPEVPERILDLACGTGLATYMMKNLFPVTHVIGADLSERMIHQLRQKAKDSGSSDIDALVCHSGKLPFGNGRIDLVTTQNAPPYPEEMIRVLRPGGRLILAYSFVYMGLVRSVVKRRLDRLGLEEVSILQAEEGIAVTAKKPIRDIS